MLILFARRRSSQVEPHVLGTIKHNGALRAEARDVSVLLFNNIFGCFYVYA